VKNHFWDGELGLSFSHKILSLFSGCGGLDLGFHQQGFKTVWANDIDSRAVETFNHNCEGNVAVCQDIATIDPDNIPDCDIILGGFPCQDFSMIWKRQGIDTDRGNLYRHFVRFVDAKKPKVFVAENVKGLLSANKGKAIEIIQRELAEIEPRYIIKPKLYNFADFGVPQFRERVLIVGIRSDIKYEFCHPQPTHGPQTGTPYVTAGEALRDVETVEHNNEALKVTERVTERLKRISQGGNYKDIPINDPLYVKGMISHVYRRLHRDEPSKTIIAAGGGGTWGYHFEQPRPLTNRERARLQSFPDSFVFKGSVAEVRKQIGNAVPPVGVWELAKTIKQLLENLE